MEINKVISEEQFQLLDRLDAIRKTIAKYGENNFYLSFSGGKDSTILHYLLDEALPDNNIPRVFIDTGIEYNLIRKYVLSLASCDDRFVIVKPTKSIKTILNKYGYPFKSKEHSTKLHEWQLGNRDTYSMKKYLGEGRFACPSCLKYQFSDDFKLNVSQFCCKKLKKEPALKWAKENGKSIVITGMRKSEGGQRVNLHCIVTDKDGNAIKFHPLSVVDDKFEDYYLLSRGIKLCDLYYPPFNFKRTGCKGCPFALDLQEQLSIMDLYLPKERLQCEFIWAPVYAEYRRINYRLQRYEQLKLF